MQPRLNLSGNPVAARFAKYLISAGKALSDSALPAATQELVEIRPARSNGGAVCIDMHTKDAAHTRESQQRLNLVARGGRRKCSPRPSGPRWSSLSRAPGLLTPLGVSPARPGRMRPSTTTTSSSARWWRSSPGLTPGTGSTSSPAASRRLPARPFRITTGPRRPATPLAGRPDPATGATGLIGSTVAGRLRSDGDEAVPLSRNRAARETTSGDRQPCKHRNIDTTQMDGRETDERPSGHR